MPPRAGVLGFTRANSAPALAQYGIRVNAVAPLLLNRHGRPVDAGLKVEAKLAGSVLTLGRPEEVAETVVFLAPRTVSPHIGQTLSPRGRAG